MLSYVSPEAIAPGGAAPRLAIVVVVYNMAREAPRTLYSLSSAYQVAAAAGDYEIVVVDNGSAEPLPKALFDALEGRFRYFQLDDAGPSPAAAINFGAAQTNAPAVGIMIDGARLASPGVVGQSLIALKTFANPVICTVGFHLGPEMQTTSPAKGYDRRAEDALLDGIGWRRNGYRLFEISALAGSCQDGWFGSFAESNLIVVKRALFDALGGFDERFDLPGGGFVNLDFYNRALAVPDRQLISLFGEGTFHQIHGGVMTNRAAAKLVDEFARYTRQYREIRGADFAAASERPLLFAAPQRPFLPGLRQAGRWMAAAPRPGGAAALPPLSASGDTWG